MRVLVTILPATSHLRRVLPAAQALRRRGHDVIVLRVLDPAEVDFGFDVPAMFRDAESGRELYSDPGAARAERRRAA